MKLSLCSLRALFGQICELDSSGVSLGYAWQSVQLGNEHCGGGYLCQAAEPFLI